MGRSIFFYVKLDYCYRSFILFIITNPITCSITNYVFILFYVTILYLLVSDWNRYLINIIRQQTHLAILLTQVLLNHSLNFLMLFKVPTYIHFTC